MTNKPDRPEIQGVSIVVRGSLNPAIFQPFWFSGNNLIREGEATAAEIKIINSEVAIFSSEWFSLQVLADRYVIDTHDPTMFQPLRDLALGTFKILEHTPITAFGFNMYQHFRMSSEDEWHALGHYYAPKDSWNDIMTNPGMRSLVIEGGREDCEATQVQIRLEPSRKVNPGVFVSVNEHYDLPEEEETSPTDRIMFLLKTLQNSWDDFLSYGNEAGLHLLGEFAKRST